MNPSPKDTGKRPAEFTIGIEAHPEYIELDLISHNNALASEEVYNLIEKSAYLALERKLAKAVEAIAEVKSWYPTDIFLEDGKSQDALSAKMARKTCDNILNKFNELCAELESVK